MFSHGLLNRLVTKIRAKRPTDKLHQPEKSDRPLDDYLFDDDFETADRVAEEKHKAAIRRALDEVT